MRLWYLYPKPGSKVYDGYDSMYDSMHSIVVRARNEQQARTIAADACGGEGNEVWLNEKKTYCEPLAAKGEPGVICREVNAG